MDSHITQKEEGRELLELLREQLYAPYPGERENAARRLATFGPLALEALADLEIKVRDPSNGVRDAARLALLKIQRQSAAAPRPKWKDRDRNKGLTAPAFLLEHYRSEIEAGTLTTAMLQVVDRQLYNAMRNRRRSQTVSYSRQQGRMRAEKPVSEEALADIRAALVDIKAQMSSIGGSNVLKTEIGTDISQIELETERPAPRKSALKIFLESLRDNLAKAAGAAATASIVIIGGILAKYFGLF